MQLVGHSALLTVDSKVDHVRTYPLVHVRIISKNNCAVNDADELVNQRPNPTKIKSIFGSPLNTWLSCNFCFCFPISLASRSYYPSIIIHTSFGLKIRTPLFSTGKWQEYHWEPWRLTRRKLSIQENQSNPSTRNRRCCQRSMRVTTIQARSSMGRHLLAQSSIYLLLL